MALTNKLTAIADSIRGKLGTTDAMTLDEMPNKISSIETGPSIQENKTIEITSNGTTEVMPDDGYGGIKKVGVSVAVPIPEPVLQEKSVNITKNGQTSVTPDAGKDGLSKVNITANIQFVRTIELSETSETEVESLGALVVAATMGTPGIDVNPKELCRENFEEIVIDVTLPNGMSMVMVYCVDVDTTILPILAGQTPSTVTFRSAAGEVSIPISGIFVTVSPEILNEIKSQITTWVHGILGSTPTITFSNPAHIGTKLF